MLTTLVNFAHTLDQSAIELFSRANEEITSRLRGEYVEKDARLMVQPEDLVKILNVLLDHK